MTFAKSLLAASIAALSLSAAQAATITPINLAGNTLDGDFSSPGSVAFDITVNNTNLMTFQLNVEAGDLLASTLSFNSVVNSFLPAGLSYLQYDFKTVDAQSGTAVDQFSLAAGAVTESPSNVFTIAMGSPVFTALNVGNPLSQPNQINWLLSTAGFAAGQTYEFTVQAIPEPSELAMLLAGMGLVGAIARKRKTAI